MIQNPDILLERSRFLLAIRNFMAMENIVEIDTPFLKQTGGMEPFLDPLSVQSPSGDTGYLITSPEYSLKEALSVLRDSSIAGIYELAHSFRSGEKGLLHTVEFLMLEFYLKQKTEKDLILFCQKLFSSLNDQMKVEAFQSEKTKIVTMDELFRLQTGRGFSSEELFITIQERGLSGSKDDRYDELFFTVFLNLVEPNFSEGPIFVTDWPPELAALARIENNVARRVEVYWKGVELGNGFYELNDPTEQWQRFTAEQTLRKELGKEVFAIDNSFLQSLDKMPIAAGIAIGLDRLFMIYLGRKNLREISPYYIDNEYSH